MELLRHIFHKWRNDFNYRTFLSAGCSFASSFIFAFYNAYLGIRHLSIWNGSICVYYLILSVIRGILIVSEDRIYRKSSASDNRIRKTAFYASSIALIILNLSLIAPISLMVVQRKPLSLGLIPVLAVAAYTFYKIILACINFKKKNRSGNLFVKELRTINLIDALLSIASLQNALITYKESGSEMLLLSAISSAVILVLIIIISFNNYFTGKKELQNLF